MSGNATARQLTPNSGQNAGQQLQMQNAQARAAILAQSQNMIQSIQSGVLATVTPGANVINVSPRLVGFLKRFYVEINFTITNNDPSLDLNLTPFGPANILQQLVFTDLSNNTRIQTTGAHLNFLSTVKRQSAFGAAFINDSPMAYGDNFAVVRAPSTIAHGGGIGVVSMIFEVPITYSDTDFRGGIWLGVTNATANLQLTINTNPTVAAGGDPTNAVYIGSTTTVLGPVAYNVYQNYLDQLPTGRGGVVLPINDISTVYLLNNTTVQGMTAGQDYPVPYANFRDFLSTFAVFDNGGVLNAGSDVNYWAIQAANYVNTIKIDPFLSALFTRNIIMDDVPPGVYYFSHRHKPISTIQFGNQELILNASSVASGAVLQMFYESFALVNLIAQAGALAVS